MRLFRQNIGLKILSLILAMGLWSIVRVIGAPTGETPAQRVFTLPIVPSAPSQPDLIARFEQKEVTITLRGKRTVLDRIGPGQINVDVDLGRRGPGVFLEKVNVLAPGGAEVSEVEPSHIWVTISRRESAQVPVRIQVVGRPPQGFELGVPAVEPRIVKVEGAEDDVEKVAAVVAPVNLSGASRNFSIRARTLQPVNSSGIEVPGVVVDAEGVDVTIPVSPAPKSSQTDVDARNVQVQESDGWDYTTRVEPSTVTVTGPAGSPAPTSVPLDAVTFPHSDEPQSRAVRVRPPDGFTVEGDGTVRVTVTPSREPATP